MENKYLFCTINKFKKISKNNINNNDNNDAKNLNTCNYLFSIKYSFDNRNITNNRYDSSYNNSSYNNSCNNSDNKIKNKFLRTCDLFMTYIYILYANGVYS